jgi:hypothetical protein
MNNKKVSDVMGCNWKHLKRITKVIGRRSSKSLAEDP